MNRGSLARAWPTAASILALIVGLAAVDDDIRNYFSRMFHGAASAELTMISWRAQDAGWIVVQAIRDQSIEHGPLMIFAIAAGVLVLFMLRT